MTEETSTGERFLKTLAEHETGLVAYIRCVVSHSADADDILQETKIVMWRKFGEFTEGTDFRAWARTIALHQILNYRRKEKRRTNIYTDEVVDAIAAELERQVEFQDASLKHLQHCLQKLPDAHRLIVLARYYQSDDIDAIAGRTGRSSEAVYRLLSRIRVALATCIQRQIRQTEEAL